MIDKIPFKQLSFVRVNEPVSGSPDGSSSQGTVNRVLDQIHQNVKFIETIVPYHKFNAQQDPTILDSRFYGYQEGSLWYNALTSVLYICIDPTENNSVWLQLNSSELNNALNNFNAVQNPTTDDNMTLGYRASSVWFNSNTSSLFYCISSSPTTAVWINLSNQGSSQTSILSNYTANRNPNQNDDETLGYSEGSEWFSTENNNFWVCVDATQGSAVWVILTINNEIIDHVFQKNASLNTIRQDPTYTTYTESFVFGGRTLNDSGVFTDRKRMLFDKTSGSFRSGNADADQFDDDNRGLLSVAFGNNPIANTNYSSAFGNYPKSNFENSLSISSGYLTSQYDSVVEFVPCRAITNDDNWLDVFTASSALVFPENATISLIIDVVGKDINTSNMWAYQLKSLIHSSQSALIKNTKKEIIYDDDNPLTDVRIIEDSGNIKLQVKGISSTTIKWGCLLTAIEIF